MPSSEDIEAQKRLLDINRKNAQLYLEQRDRLGYAHITPAIAHGLAEARSNIERSKSILRAWDIQVEDLPIDEEVTTQVGARNLNTITTTQQISFFDQHRIKIITASVSVLVIILIGTIIPYFSENIFPWPSRKSSQQNLIDVLNTRAKMISGKLEDADKSYGSDTTNYKAYNELFSDLHIRNVEALRNNDLVLSHEITRDIQHLIAIVDQSMRQESMGEFSNPTSVYIERGNDIIIPEIRTFNAPVSPTELLDLPTPLPQESDYQEPEVIDEDRLKRIRMRIQEINASIQVDNLPTSISEVLITPTNAPVLIPTPITPTDVPVLTPTQKKAKPSSIYGAKTVSGYSFFRLYQDGIVIECSTGDGDDIHKAWESVIQWCNMESTYLFAFFGSYEISDQSISMTTNTDLGEANHKGVIAGQNMILTLENPVNHQYTTETFTLLYTLPQ